MVMASDGKPIGPWVQDEPARDKQETQPVGTWVQHETGDIQEAAQPSPPGRFSTKLGQLKDHKKKFILLLLLLLISVIVGIVSSRQIVSEPKHKSESNMNVSSAQNNFVLRPE